MTDHHRYADYPGVHGMLTYIDPRGFGFARGSTLQDTYFVPEDFLVMLDLKIHDYVLFDAVKPSEDGHKPMVIRCHKAAAPETPAPVRPSKGTGRELDTFLNSSNVAVSKANEAMEAAAEDEGEGEDVGGEDNWTTLKRRITKLTTYSTAMHSSATAGDAKGYREARKNLLRVIGEIQEIYTQMRP